MAHSPNLPHKLPNPISILTCPGWAFSQVAKSGYGYGRIFGFLLIEFLLLRPLQATSALLQTRNSLLGGVSQFWNRYLHFALAPGLAVFLLGIGFYYLLRFTSREKLDIYPAASTLAHAWIPHTLWVILSVLLLRLGVSHPVLVSFPYRSVAHSPLLTLCKFSLEFGPSILLGVIGLIPVVKAHQPSFPGRHNVRRLVGVLSILVLTFAAERTTRHIITHWDSVRPVMIGDKLPPFSLSELHGARIDSTGIEGKITILDFWATWCSPCVASMPYLADLYNDYQPKGLMFVSVNTEPDNTDAVRQFHSQNKLPFPVYVDTGALQNRLKVTSLPTLIIIDEKGIVQHIHIGLTSMITIKKDLDALFSR